jgi:hypothetical protein
MGVYEVTGAKILRKGFKIKNALKTSYIWSTKYTKFEHFYKNPVSIAKPMPEDYFTSR